MEARTSAKLRLRGRASAAASISRCSASALRPCAPARSLSARTSSSSIPRTSRSAISSLQTSDDINDIIFPTACQGRTFWDGAIFKQLNTCARSIPRREDAGKPAAKTGIIKQGSATPTPPPDPVLRTPQPQAPQPQATLSPVLLEAQSNERQAQANYNAAKNKFDGILKGQHTAEQLANAATALENTAGKWAYASMHALNYTPHRSPEAEIAEKNYKAACKEVSHAQDQVVKYVWHVDPTKDFFTPSSSVRPVAHQTPPEIARAKKTRARPNI